MQIVPPPDPMGAASGRSDWQSTPGDRPPLPAINPAPPFQTPFSRPLGQHVGNYALVGAFELQTYSFFLLVFIPIHILLQNWEMVGLLFPIIALNLVAVRLARRPESPGRWTRLLCAFYFATTRDSTTRKPVLRTLRLPILLAGAALPLLSFAPIAPHHRPPLVDMRYLDKNGFFREAGKVQLEIELGKRPREDSLLGR